MWTRGINDIQFIQGPVPKLKKKYFSFQKILYITYSKNAVLKNLYMNKTYLTKNVYQANNKTDLINL